MVVLLKVTGVIKLVVGVKPVEAIKVSNPRQAMTLEGVSMTIPSTEEVTGTWALTLSVNGLLGFNLLGCMAGKLETWSLRL